MVIKEQTRGNVESNYHINGIVFMRSKDKEDSKHVQDPAASVQVVHIGRCVYKKEHLAQNVLAIHMTISVEFASPMLLGHPIQYMYHAFNTSLSQSHRVTSANPPKQASR